MKKYFLLYISLLFLNGLSAQVVIDNTHMPVPDDTISRRTTNSVNGLDYTLTGSSYTWDFSSLSSPNSVVDTFVSVLSTPVLYNVAFSNPFDPEHLATVAFKQTMQSIPIMQISDGYSFMKNSSAQYAQVGVGVKINGIAIPMKFSNPEILYHFPVTYNTRDSSDAEYHASIPSFGYYGESRHRVNFVDGWGTLYLPGDTFNVIRIKSVVEYNDSVYLDTLGFGFHFPRTETEYKWLTPGHHEPVLQITKQNNFVTVKYFTLLPIDYGIETIKNTLANIYPNPASDFMHVCLNSNSPIVTISITDITGKEIYRKTYNNVSETDIAVSHLTKGLYLIRIENAGQSSCLKFIKE